MPTPRVYPTCIPILCTHPQFGSRWMMNVSIWVQISLLLECMSEEDKVGGHSTDLAGTDYGPVVGTCTRYHVGKSVGQFRN